MYFQWTSWSLACNKGFWFMFLSTALLFSGLWNFMGFEGWECPFILLVSMTAFSIYYSSQSPFRNDSFSCAIFCLWVSILLSFVLTGVFHHLTMLINCILCHLLFMSALLSFLLTGVFHRSTLLTLCILSVKKLQVYSLSTLIFSWILLYLLLARRACECPNSWKFMFLGVAISKWHKVNDSRDNKQYPNQTTITKRTMHGQCFPNTYM